MKNEAKVINTVAVENIKFNRCVEVMTFNPMQAAHVHFNREMS